MICWLAKPSGYYLAFQYACLVQITSDKHFLKSDPLQNLILVIKEHSYVVLSCQLSPFPLWMHAVCTIGVDFIWFSMEESKWFIIFLKWNMLTRMKAHGCSIQEINSCTLYLKFCGVVQGSFSYHIFFEFSYSQLVMGEHFIILSSLWCWDIIYFWFPILLYSFHLATKLSHLLDTIIWNGPVVEQHNNFIRVE